MFETFHHAKFGKNRFKRGRDTVFFRFFKMASAAILKKWNNRHISATVQPVLTELGVVKHFEPLNRPDR